MLTGALYSFILALQEASATLLLVVPGHEMMTVGIFNFYIGGSVNEAAALGLILIILGADLPPDHQPACGFQDGGAFSGSTKAGKRAQDTGIRCNSTFTVVGFND